MEVGHKGSVNILYSHCRKQKREQEQITEQSDAPKEPVYIGIHRSEKHSSEWVCDLSLDVLSNLSVEKDGERKAWSNEYCTVQGRTKEQGSWKWWIQKEEN